MLAQMESLATWLVNPWLFVGGLAAAALTVIIHLLSRRKYRLVEWAAMEFLLAANQENRRRIRIENLALLALRCLARNSVAGCACCGGVSPRQYTLGEHSPPSYTGE